MQKVRSINIRGGSIPHFDYEEFGVKGVGQHRTPIISMDKFIDHSLNKELHIECCKGLALNEKFYKQGMIFGAITTEEEKLLIEIRDQASSSLTQPFTGTVNTFDKASVITPLLNIALKNMSVLK